MKSKYDNKLVFWADSTYRRYANKSPYWFVFKVEKDRFLDRFVVHYIDRFGNRDTMTTNKYYLQKDAEILDLKNQGHLLKDIIKSIYER